MMNTKRIESLLVKFNCWEEKGKQIVQNFRRTVNSGAVYVEQAPHHPFRLEYSPPPSLSKCSRLVQSSLAAEVRAHHSVERMTALTFYQAASWESSHLTHQNTKELNTSLLFGELHFGS